MFAISSGAEVLEFIEEDRSWREFRYPSYVQHVMGLVCFFV